MMSIFHERLLKITPLIIFVVIETYEIMTNSTSKIGK